MAETDAASPIARKYLRLHLCREVGAIRFANLLRELGDIDAVLGAGVSQLMRADKVGEVVAENIARGRDEIDVDAECDLAQSRGARILCLADNEYPPALKTIPDPPACLYVRGTLQPEDAVALAIVGSRRCSHYGAEQAERFGALASNAGLVVISGMARGIDTAAHRGALAGGGRTIAVIGCGLCHLYPPESTELAERIIEHGALISELPMNVPPDSKNFPPRNRIVVGLALGVLVVEAGHRSGALISARLGSEYNREVFALPGRLDTPYAHGCHKLIRDSAAKLVTNLGDILDELGEAGATLKEPDSQEQPDAQPAAKTIAKLDDVETRILDLMGSGSATIEELCDLSALPPARVAAAMTGLQLKGVIRRIAPDLYERVGGE